MSNLSKADAREIKNIETNMQLGNMVAVKQGALSFIRSATSDAVQRKRIAALAEIGIVLSAA